jgi:hypothetical protein
MENRTHISWDLMLAYLGGAKFNNFGLQTVAESTLPGKIGDIHVHDLQTQRLYEPTWRDRFIDG